MTVRRLTGVVLGVVATLTICAGSVALAIVAFPLADYRPADAATLRDETVAVVSRTTAIRRRRPPRRSGVPPARSRSAMPPER